jgi:hypothetical protein
LLAPNNVRLRGSPPFGCYREQREAALFLLGLSDLALPGSY